MTDDASLIQGLMEGREDAFAALYDRYAPALLRVAWAWLRCRSDAEDAVQEALLGVFRSRALLGRVENLRAYLFSALRHAATRLADRRKPATPLALDDLPAKAEPAEAGADPDLTRRLEAALAALPRPQREVVTLKVDGGLTFAEVAAVLGIRPNTAASRYRYALEKLRAVLAEERHERRISSPGPAGPGATARPPSRP